MITLGSMGESIRDGIYKFAFETYEVAPKIKNMLFDVKTMDGEYKKGMDYVVDAEALLIDGETEQARDSQIKRGYPWIIRMRDIRAQISLTKKEMKYGFVDIPAIGKKLGEAFIEKEEATAARIFNNGGLTAGDWIFNNSILGGNDPINDSSGDLIYDSKAFFDTDHPRTIGDTTYSNFTSNALTADAAGITNLQSALTLMEYTNAYDNAGTRIMIRPNLLVVPPSLRFTAEEILTTTQGKPYVATNETNVMSGILNMVVWPWLDDSDGWFVGQAKKGIEWYDQGSLEIETSYDASQRIWNVFLTKTIGIGVTNWRYWLSNNISAS